MASYDDPRRQREQQFSELDAAPPNNSTVTGVDGAPIFEMSAEPAAPRIYGSPKPTPSPPRNRQDGDDQLNMANPWPFYLQEQREQAANATHPRPPYPENDQSAERPATFQDDDDVPAPLRVSRPAKSPPPPTHTYKPYVPPPSEEDSEETIVKPAKSPRPHAPGTGTFLPYRPYRPEGEEPEEALAAAPAPAPSQASTQPQYSVGSAPHHFYVPSAGPSHEIAKPPKSPPPGHTSGEAMFRPVSQPVDMHSHHQALPVSPIMSPSETFQPFQPPPHQPTASHAPVSAHASPIPPYPTSPVEQSRPVVPPKLGSPEQSHVPHAPPPLTTSDGLRPQPHPVPGYVVPTGSSYNTAQSPYGAPRAAESASPTSVYDQSPITVAPSQPSTPRPQAHAYQQPQYGLLPEAEELSPAEPPGAFPPSPQSPPPAYSLTESLSGPVAGLNKRAQASPYSPSSPASPVQDYRPPPPPRPHSQTNATSAPNPHSATLTYAHPPPPPGPPPPATSPRPMSPPGSHHDAKTTSPSNPHASTMTYVHPPPPPGPPPGATSRPMSPSHHTNSNAAVHHESAANTYRPPPLPPRPTTTSPHTQHPVGFSTTVPNAQNFPPPPKASHGPPPKSSHAIPPPQPPRPTSSGANSRPGGYGKLFSSSSAKKWLDKTNQALESTLAQRTQGQQQGNKTRSDPAAPPLPPHP